jgi:ankyrin repeat protein
LQDGFTALICAVTDGHADCVRLLLDAGANKKVKNKVRDCSATTDWNEWRPAVVFLGSQCFINVN